MSRKFVKLTNELWPELVLPVENILQIQSDDSGALITYRICDHERYIKVRETPAAILALINGEEGQTDKALLEAAEYMLALTGMMPESRQLSTFQMHAATIDKARAHCGKPFTAGMSCGECGPGIETATVKLLESAEFMHRLIMETDFPIDGYIPDDIFKEAPLIVYKFGDAIKAARAAVEGKSC